MSWIFERADSRVFGSTAPFRQDGDAIDDFAGDVKASADAYAAGRDAAIYIDNTLGSAYAREEAYDRRNAAIKKATGVDLPNPMREDRTRLGLDLAMGAGLVPGLTAPAERFREGFGEQARAYEDRLAELATTFADNPEALAAIGAGRPIDDDVRTMAQGMEKRTAEALAAESARPWLKWGGYFAGSLVGGFRDPVNVAALFVGAPGATVAKTAAGAIARTALREAVVNAGTEAAMQPIIQNWRAELGLESGLAEAAKNVGMAAAFGGIIGGGVEAVARAARAARRPAGAEPAPIERALAGEEKPLAEAVRTAGDAVSPAGRAAASAMEDDALVRGSPPPRMASEDHDANLAQAVRAAESPDDEMPPLPFDIPPERADPPPLPDAGLGEHFTYLKKPVTFELADASRIQADAQAFQYKGGGDASGVTDRLRSVSRWDNIASGKVVVYERADGRRYIADGHQRLGLARRLLAEGAEDAIRLNAFIFRERDGWSVPDVRAIAAKKNLQEGSGDVLDTARILRELPTILDGTVPTGSEHMRTARGLARLSDDAFGLTLRGRIAPVHAAVVGELMGDRALHAPAIEALMQVEDLSIARARYMVADIARAPTSIEVQHTLFGALERTVPLIVERAKVLDKAIGALRKERSAFRTVLANADRLADAGNVIDAGGSKGAAEAAASAIDAVERLALRAGAISDALDRAAVALNGGTRIGEATDAFVREVTDLVEKRGIIALATEDAPARPKGLDDPTGPEAQAQADALAGGQRAEMASAGKPRESPPSPRADAAGTKPEPAPEAPRYSADEQVLLDEVVHAEDILLGVRQCSLF